MTDPERLEATIAAAVLVAASTSNELLRSIVEVARAVFGARACSVMRYDAAASELVWVAVSGEGQDELEGRRIAATTGLAGWVLASGEPIIVDDVAQEPRFARMVAESTGYVPAGMMIAPLLRDDETAAGVFSVLDRTRHPGESLAELDLLGRFAAQATQAMRLRSTVEQVEAILDGQDDELQSLARAARALLAVTGPQRDPVVSLLSALSDVLERP